MRTKEHKQNPSYLPEPDGKNVYREHNRDSYHPEEFWMVLDVRKDVESETFKNVDPKWSKTLKSKTVQSQIENTMGQPPKDVREWGELRRERGKWEFGVESSRWKRQIYKRNY